uniref:Uncharacterized protein n=1 Tax=Lactuca sativa TaxID=4236 RepID=A0A9R1UFR9_LACSA|nr:hypothetical protein LSAT_V11C900502540 [Lactuca sativa]
MGRSHLNSVILILFSVSLASFSGNIIAEARKLAEIPELPVVPKPELPVVPKPEIPVLPKPELPVLPKPEIPVLPKPELPVLPKPELPEVPKPDVPVVPKPAEVPEFPKPTFPVIPKPTLPELPKDFPIPSHHEDDSICLSNSPSSKIGERLWSDGMAAMINLFVYTFGNNIDKMLKTDQEARLNQTSPSNMTKISLPFYCP